MAPELAVQEKKELVDREERTIPAKYYVPAADIYETEAALVVVLEMPGVEKQNVSVHVERNVLQVEGKIEFSNYENAEALYTEYNVGHFARSFSLSSVVDHETIEANLDDGILTLTLHKKKEVKPKRIQVN